MNKIQKIASVVALSAVVVASSAYSYLLIKHNYVANIPQIQVADVSRAIAELQRISLPESLCYVDVQIKALESDLQNTVALSNPTAISNEIKRINAEITKLQVEDKSLRSEIKKFNDRVTLATSPFGKAKSAHDKLIAEKTKLEKTTKLSVAQVKRLTELTVLIDAAKAKLETERSLIESDRQLDTDRRNRSAIIPAEIAKYRENIKSLQDKNKSATEEIKLIKAKLNNANTKKCASSGLVSTSTLSAPSEKVLKFKDTPCVSNTVVAELNKATLLAVSDIKRLQDSAIRHKSAIEKNAAELKKAEEEVSKLAKLNPTDNQLAEAQKQYSDADNSFKQIDTTPINDTRRSQLPSLLKKRIEKSEALNKIANNRRQYNIALGVVNIYKTPQSDLDKVLTDLNQAYVDYVELKNIGSSFTSKFLCESTSSTTKTTTNVSKNNASSNAASQSGKSAGKALDCGLDNQDEAITPVQCPNGGTVCSEAECSDTNHSNNVCEIPEDDEEADTVGSGWTISGSVPFFSVGACTADNECNTAKKWSETSRSEDSLNLQTTINCKKVVFEVCKSPDGSRISGKEVAKTAVCYKDIPRIEEGI